VTRATTQDGTSSDDGRLIAKTKALPNGLELREASPEGIRAASRSIPVGPRDCEGQLLGGPGNGSPILAHSGGPGTLQLSACQPGQSQILGSFQGCSELFGGSGTPPPSEANILQPAAFASYQAPPGFLHAFQEPRIVL